MKAARFYGERVVRVEEVEVKKLSKDEVRIEVEWCGICGVSGPMMIKNLPITLGHEFSGTVTEVGENVTHVNLGDNVVVEPIQPCLACTNCKNGLNYLCEKLGQLDFKYDGFADYSVVNGSFVHKLQMIPS